MPEFPIVDSHVHIYDVARLRYSWMTARPKLNRTYLLDDFDRARGAVAVERLVFAEVNVSPGLHLEEAAWAQGVADREPRLAGIIAHAPLDKGAAVAADLERLVEHRAVRGIRRLIETEADPSFCLEPGFLEGVRLLSRFGLTFDLCPKHWGLVYALEVARRCPEVAFVLDHIGKPDIKNGLWEPWAGTLRELAALPNVTCKISGVITEADHAAWTVEQVRPYVAHAIDCFGFDRVMFGSDWTVALLTHEYPTWVAVVDEIVANCTDEERRKLYCDNAVQVYRL